jgi:hypothetical protein
MGQALADALGLKEATITEDESAKGVLEQVNFFSIAFSP